MTEKQPSAKGNLVLGAVVAARRHRDQGRISVEALEARLSPAATLLLDQKIHIASWYPIQVFSELIDLNWEIGGRRDPDFMRREGERSADRLFVSGIYQQLHFAESASKVKSREELLRQSRLITSITASLYNFLETTVGVDPARPSELRIVYGNATLFSEALRFSTEGFMNQINARQKSARRWTSERPAADRVVFRMEMPERLKDG